MTLNEFYERYQGFFSSDLIEIACDKCGTVESRKKTKVQQKISKYGEYLCEPHSVVRRFELGLSDETREKLRNGRLGSVHSEETKRRMSELKKIFYQTERGQKVRKILSRAAAMQNANTNIESTRRRGLFPSKKNNDFRVYGSSYELRAFTLLDEDGSVEDYRSQVYYEIEDHSRSLDLIIRYHGGKTLVVEIKAEKRLLEAAVAQQIEDNMQYALDNGYDFDVWTEVDLGFNSPHEATRWADEYISKMTSIDYISVRRRRATERSIKYYHENLKTQVDVYCPFCKEEHTLREEQYLDNIEDNGRYICARENGHIQGKKSKDHLKNPHASEGKKKCSGACQEIKPLEEFSVSNKETGALCGPCKKCRAAAATAAYQAKKEGKS